MNYEDFYRQEQTLEKAANEKLQSIVKFSKNVSKSAEAGDVKSLCKNMAQQQAVLHEYTELTDRLLELAEGFDGKGYMENGDFARQLIEYCERYSVDIKGEFPTYEVFPYKVKIDAENQEITVNRSKVQCLRPQRFVEDIRKSREKYMKSAFNVNTFLNELAAAYDLAVIEKGSKSKTPLDERDLYLKDLYGYMAPTARARRDYDTQNFAFDLARLYPHRDLLTKDSRGYQFGTVKTSGRFIRILDHNGQEQLLGTVRFFRKEA